ncbi:MAG: glycosyltransferase family 4 protein [Candidatus Lokiarchaeia archaeon]
MKVMYISTGILKEDIYPDPNQGGQVQIWGIAKQLEKKGYDVTILKAGNSNKKEVVDNILLLNVKSKFKQDIFRGIPTQLLFSKKSIKIIKSEKPDILSLQFRYSGYFPSKLNIPKIFTLHSPNALDYFKPYAIRHHILNHPYFHFRKIIETRLMSNSNWIVVLNKFIENYLKNKGYLNVKMIPNAINPKDFYNKGDDNFILYAGRFDWAKRVGILIKAYSMLDKDYRKNFKLKIVGQGNEEQYLKNLVKSKNIEKNVEFFPWIERKKLINLMARCSIFVLPSLFEMMPVVVIEVMDCSKPVISSNIPGPQDIITHGYDGFLFERGNISELKRYLELLLEDENLRRKIGKKARKTAEEKYTFKKIVERHISLFNELRVNRIDMSQKSKFYS